MKIKDGYDVHKVAGEWIVFSLNEDVDLSKLINLNESGYILWKKLAVGAEFNELVLTLVDEYGIDDVVAKKGVEKFVGKLKDNGFIE